ncbi:MAG: molybdenum ABC transporter ATP-binding protein [Thermodesulfobacteriota bacterium]|nr:molybdenum ABC transporter ATP-binding protein [Thermodesulfobacteriota bacterium]
MNLTVSVEKTYQGFTLQTDFTATAGRTGVFGPSGSGKSTLMHILAGLVNPDRGVIALDGRTLFDSTQRVCVSPEKRRIGVVFQHAHLFPHMNVKQNLLYGYKRTPASLRIISPDTLIDVLSLGHLLDRSIDRLSGGERQRVALGRTILACPRLILMDEPLTGLDESLKYQIIPYLRRVFETFEIPLMFISHSLREMRLMTDQVMVLEEGRLIHILSSEDLARYRLLSGAQTYANLVTLEDPVPDNDLYRYRWGAGNLVLTEPGQAGDNLFELPAREITLFKRHPEASSARNILDCTVTDIVTVGNRVAVEMRCFGQTLICQIVPESVKELGITINGPVVAAIKASAFRKLL